MITQQLIEMAVLDALALLDDDERIDFERSFQTATPEIQAHVRREQTRLCNIDAILPNVEPPAGLRAAVLAAVRDEIELQTLTVDRSPHLEPARRVSSLWRAATVGLATAAVLLGGAFVWVNQQIGEINSVIENFTAMDAVQSELGPGYAAAARSPLFQKVAMTPVSAGIAGSAVLEINDEAGEIYLVCENLPIQDGRSYTLILINGDEEIELTRFKSDGTVVYPKVAKQVTIQQDSRLVLMGSDDNGQVMPMFTTSL